MPSSALWELEFGLEVSVLYHDWRRATYLMWSRWIKVATIFGALLAAAAWTPWGSALVATWVIPGASLVIAVLNLFDIVFGFGESALRHTNLYKRFMDLQAEIDRCRVDADGKIDQWRAKSREIRGDEAPTMWAIYATAWNQVIERHGIDRGLSARRIALWQNTLRNVFEFRPADFPTG